MGFDLYIPHAYLKAGLAVSLLTVWVLVGLFQYLNRYTRRRYFSIWTAAWLFYALFLTLSISAQDRSANMLLLMSKNWCVGTSGAFLLWGSFRFLKFHAPQRLIGGFILFLVAWSYCAAAEGNSVLWVQAPTFFLLGLASLFTAGAYLDVRRKKGFIGAGLLAFGFAFWGGYMTGYPFLQTSDDLISMAFFLSAVLQLFIAVSMIILVLEEARATSDLTRRRLLEQKSRARTLRSRVRSTEDRYQKLFEHAGEAIIIASSRDLRILTLNDAAKRLLGTSPEPSGLHLSQFLSGAETNSRSGEEWFQWLAERREVWLTRANGESVQTEVSGARVSFGAERAFQFFFRELTERARLEQQLRQAEKLSALGQMISGLSHELNNPLAAVKGYLELILARHELSGQTRSDLERVAQEANRAAKLVQNFLAFARQEPLESRELDLKEVIQTVVELRKFEMRVTGTELRLDLAEDELRVIANRDQMQQVLVNLVNNAIHAMMDQDRKILQISGRQLGDMIQVRVTDNGPGVPIEVLPRIFEPFFTTKPVGTGTGLGLSIAHRIMTEHKGRVFHERPPGGGACFVVELPAAPVNQSATPELEESPSEPSFSTSSSSSASGKILVLDDERSISELLVEMLRMLGYSATECNSPLKALKLLEEEEFDVILSDFRMPGMNGEQFYAAAVQRRPHLARRVIFLTGDTVNEETRTFLKNTGNPHLAKPFQLASVEQAVSRVLAREPQSLAA